MADPKHVEIDIHFTSREQINVALSWSRPIDRCEARAQGRAELPAVSVFNGCGEIYAVRRMSKSR